MIKNLVIKYAKKYVISSMNELLEKNKDDVQKITETMLIWIKRLQIVVEELKVIMCRVSDGKIDDEEVEQSQNEIEQIVKDW